MKELIKQIDALPLIVKIILAIPALDIIWGIYRIVRAVDTNNIAGIVIGIVLLFVPVMWIIDIVMILLKGNVWYYA